MSEKIDITLTEILGLVGNLDDKPGEETPRERFRRFLKEKVHKVGQVRDYVYECLENKGDQYNRALQDLVNHIGELLGFKVTYGRYRGVQGQVGFDGHWKSPTGFNIVIEVKTTETYAIKTSTLIGYVNDLISERKISGWEKTLGLYVFGKTDPQIRQLENAIIAEKRTSQLRFIGIESLLSLAEMMNEYDVSHEDILAVLRPSTPAVDPVVDLIARLIAQPKEKELENVEMPHKAKRDDNLAYWLTPVRSDASYTAEDVVRRLVVEEQIYAFGERTPGRKRIKPGDWICFYATGKGTIAHAQIASKPEKKPHPSVRNPEKYPYTFQVRNAHLYFDKPIVLNSTLRQQLEAFRERDPNRPWGWFVQSTRKVSENDFKLLTRQSPNR